MAHYHPKPRPGVVLYDGCAECEARAKNIRGLHHLDQRSINALWRKMQAFEFGNGLILTDAEYKASRVLYDVAVLLEHITGDNAKFARPLLRFDPGYAEGEIND